MPIADQQVSPARVDTPTAAQTVRQPSVPEPTLQELIPESSQLRYRANAVHSDVTSLNREIYEMSLAEVTTAKERSSVSTLLDSLVQMGFGWSAIARLTGVSVPALRKWRVGQGASPTSRHALARVAALVEMLADQFMIEDPAAWLEIPLAGTPVTVGEIYAAGKIDLVIDYANRWITTPEVLLDSYSPDWQVKHARRAYETFVAADGELGIRATGR
jgi:hypothetical protein